MTTTFHWQFLWAPDNEWCDCEPGSWGWSTLEAARAHPPTKYRKVALRVIQRDIADTVIEDPHV